MVPLQISIFLESANFFWKYNSNQENKIPFVRGSFRFFETYIFESQNVRISIIIDSFFLSKIKILYEKS